MGCLTSACLGGGWIAVGQHCLVDTGGSWLCLGEGGLVLAVLSPLSARAAAGKRVILQASLCVPEKLLCSQKGDWGSAAGRTLSCCPEPLLDPAGSLSLSWKSL